MRKPGVAPEGLERLPTPTEQRRLARADMFEMPQQTSWQVAPVVQPQERQRRSSMMLEVVGKVDLSNGQLFLRSEMPEYQKFDTKKRA
jgi:hypothetical protein